MLFLLRFVQQKTTIIKFLIEIDTDFFLFLNSFHNSFFDVVFEWVTGRFSWLPLYGVLVLLVAVKFKKNALIIFPLVTILILLTDQVSVHLFKDVFLRLRPCHNPQIAHLVHVVDGCGGQYGFVSSHAANTFGLAIFVGVLLKQHYKWFLLGLLIWAAVVSYSRIYVGVHYPGDIIGGAILGVIIANLVLWLLRLIDKQFKTKILA